MVQLPNTGGLTERYTGGSITSTHIGGLALPRCARRGDRCGAAVLTVNGGRFAAGSIPSTRMEPVRMHGFPRAVIGRRGGQTRSVEGYRAVSGPGCSARCPPLVCRGGG